ncbi:uncharacterized protein SCODWIG_02686 [Saccharomycodes ludwigii]|uniref:Uncharacterized protein n=1 Tax=Saccharomycodes ludwigii TaxID=36035 RepID=A0A376B8D2_9ASCO|nr:hypothetical protein SCDLUD_000297 [Saccharomycodes ludwigii]KAH3902712.1 hypothetical protein SCDLUD_000297 [Saccharomycodes ludwigii]SSD60925.1 uncharacterized protein SCODWIG_02686 [Saccharomycodes ludwigii]
MHDLSKPNSKLHVCNDTNTQINTSRKQDYLFASTTPENLLNRDESKSRISLGPSSSSDFNYDMNGNNREYSYDQESVGSSIASHNNISRPQSRASVTSGLSTTAAKDGIEGKRVLRAGISPYSLNLLNALNAVNVNKSLSSHNLFKNNNESNNSNSNSIENDNPFASPMTIREKMKLLNIDKRSPVPSQFGSMRGDDPVNTSISSENIERPNIESLLKESLIGERGLGNQLHLTSNNERTLESFSNASTIGDDYSYLQDGFSNTSTSLVPTTTESVISAGNSERDA